MLKKDSYYKTNDLYFCDEIDKSKKIINEYGFNLGSNKKDYNINLEYNNQKTFTNNNFLINKR
jgi:hypothetical protein